jgi:hypothetical protein
MPFSTVFELQNILECLNVHHSNSIIQHGSEKSILHQFDSTYTFSIILIAWYHLVGGDFVLLSAAYRYLGFHVKCLIFLSIFNPKFPI